MRATLTPWAFLGPFLLLFGVFTAYPLLKSLVLVTQQTYGPEFTRFVGLENVRALMADPLFWKAMWNTLVFTLGSVFIQLPLALGLAMLLQTRGLRFAGFYRLALFSPSLVGIVFAALIFSLIFEKKTGLLNVALFRMSGGAWDIEFAWLQQYVMPALILAALWMYTGFNMVFFSAALQNVRQDLVESATLDGAGPWSRFVHVTVPAIKPVAGYVVLLSVIGSFQLFELPYLMLTNSGGPDNAGLTVVMYLYQNGFDVGDLGYASAIGWALSLVLVACAVLQRRMSRDEEASA